jgi:hypothetical protein
MTSPRYSANLAVFLQGIVPLEITEVTIVPDAAGCARDDEELLSPVSQSSGSVQAGNRNVPGVPARSRNSLPPVSPHSKPSADVQNNTPSSPASPDFSSPFRTKDKVRRWDHQRSFIDSQLISPIRCISPVTSFPSKPKVTLPNLESVQSIVKKEKGRRKKTPLAKGKLNKNTHVCPPESPTTPTPKHPKKDSPPATNPLLPPTLLPLR